MNKKVISNNKKAFHEYLIFDKYVAGIVLTGTEIKSVRKNAVNLKDSFCRVENGEIFLYNCHISPYEQGNRYNVEPTRTRKLLLTKKEIGKIYDKVKKENYVIIPIELFLHKGFAKFEIALVKGKKLYDKREDIAKKTQKRDMDRLIKNNKF